MAKSHRSFRLSSFDDTEIADSSTMKRISSKGTFLWKRLFPAAWFGFLAFFFCVALASGLNQKAPWFEFIPFIIGPLIMAGFGYIVMKHLVFDLVDEVLDAGSELVVKNRGREIHIPLAEIMNVSYVGMMNPPRITLMLRQPSELGSEISFMKPPRFLNFSMPDVARDLIARIDAARKTSQG